MGFFDRFMKKDVKLAVSPTPEKAPVPFGPATVEIARVISGGDETVMEEIAACAENPKNWFEEHRERYQERSVDSPSDLDLIVWLGLVDILENHGWVCERDWKDELEDFSYFLQNLHGFQQLGLDMNADWFNADGDIPAWCGVLTEKWAAQGVRVAAIDIDSDSYVLFPVSSAQFTALQTQAEKIGRSIEHVE